MVASSSFGNCLISSFLWLAVTMPLQAQSNAGAPTPGQTPAGTPTPGQPQAGTPTPGQRAAGTPTPGQRSAGAPTPGQPAAGNPLANRSAAASANTTPLPSGNTSFPNTTTSNTPTGFNPVTPNTTGTFPNAVLPNGTVFATGGVRVVGPLGNTGFVPSTTMWGNDPSGINLLSGTIPNQFNVVVPSTNATQAAPLTSENQAGGSGVVTADNVARLRLLARPDALVWVDGQRTEPTGVVREFVSPPIDPNREYGYEIKAEWNEGGQTITRQRKVTFFAGDRLTVNLLKPISGDMSVGTRHQTFKPNRPEGPADQTTTKPESRTNFEVATDEGVHDGVIIRVTPTSLVVRAQTQREYEYTLSPGAQITCDRSGCALAALQPGMRARVLTKNNTLHSALRVEALDRDLDFVKNTR